MDLKNLIEAYLKEARMMILATVGGDQPWSCTLYFTADEKSNLYWISTSDTRHSKEISINKKVSASIPVKFEDLTVVGVQVEGDATLVSDPHEIERAIRIYTDKFNRGEDWYKDFIAGKNEHELYRLKPRLFVLFDRENFPDDSRQELKVWKTCLKTSSLGVAIPCVNQHNFVWFFEFHFVKNWKNYATRRLTIDNIFELFVQFSNFTFI